MQNNIYETYMRLTDADMDYDEYLMHCSVDTKSAIFEDAIVKNNYTVAPGQNYSQLKIKSKTFKDTMFKDTMFKHKSCIL